MEILNFKHTVDMQALPKSGGTLTGPLILSGNPTSNLEAVPKQYLDARIGDIGTSANVAAYVNDKINDAIKWRTIGE